MQKRWDPAVRDRHEYKFVRRAEMSVESRSRECSMMIHAVFTLLSTLAINDLHRSIKDTALRV